jgi:hypothetical protein
MLQICMGVTMVFLPYATTLHHFTSLYRKFLSGIWKAVKRLFMHCFPERPLLLETL